MNQSQINAKDIQPKIMIYHDFLINEDFPNQGQINAEYIMATIMFYHDLLIMINYTNQNQINADDIQPKIQITQINAGDNFSQKSCSISIMFIIIVILISDYCSNRHVMLYSIYNTRYKSMKVWKKF